MTKAGGRFSPGEPEAPPLSFGDPDREAAAALEGSVVADRSGLGRIRMSGKDRQDLLHRLSTNEIKSLKPGEGALTALLTSRGRIVDLLHALAGESYLTLIASDGNAARVRSWLETYIFREEVALEDAGAGGCLGLYGAASASLLDRLARDNWSSLPVAHHRRSKLAGLEVRVAGTFPLAGLGFLLLCDPGNTSALWDALVAAGAVPAGSEALERLRIAAGVPELGKELTEDQNPWEAALDGAISLTKGCYVGQEVVARLRTYQKIQRRLGGLELEGDELPASGSSILFAGREVGKITSAARSPRGANGLALGFLQVDHAGPGEAVEVSHLSGSIPARVIDLPFWSPAGGASPFLPGRDSARG